MGKPRAIGQGAQLSDVADGALKSRADELPAVIGALHLVTVFVVVSDLRVPGLDSSTL